MSAKSPERNIPEDNNKRPIPTVSGDKLAGLPNFKSPSNPIPTIINSHFVTSHLLNINFSLAESRSSFNLSILLYILPNYWPKFQTRKKGELRKTFFNSHLEVLRDLAKGAKEIARPTRYQQLIQAIIKQYPKIEVYKENKATIALVKNYQKVLKH